jgi:hypothetical protein
MSESPISALIARPRDEIETVTRRLLHHIFAIFFNNLQSVTCFLHEDRAIESARSFIFKYLQRIVADMHLHSSCNYRRSVTPAVPGATLPAIALRGPYQPSDRE